MQLDGLLKSDLTKICQMAEHGYHDRLEKLIVELYVLIETASWKCRDSLMSLTRFFHLEFFAERPFLSHDD